MYQDSRLKCTDVFFFTKTKYVYAALGKCVHSQIPTLKLQTLGKNNQISALLQTRKWEISIEFRTYFRECHKISLFQVLDDSLIAFVGRVLCDTKMFTTDIRVTLLRLLAYGAIQDDFSIILHMDRKDHFIMNYAKDFESIPILEQEALALFVSKYYIY